MLILLAFASKGRKGRSQQIDFKSYMKKGEYPAPNFPDWVTGFPVSLRAESFQACHI